MPAPVTWIDTHCHLDAAEFDPDRDAVRQRARAAGVDRLVLPAVTADTFERVQALAQRHGDAYALGLHPLYLDERSCTAALEQLDAALVRCRADPRLVAVGEIGLDLFEGAPDLALQERCYAAQLDLAVREGLPVILHVRRSADRLLKHLRQRPRIGGIAHAFNGSEQQAEAFVALGLRLGFGGTLTFDRSLQIRRLATTLPLHALVLETDAPDIPPQWRYKTAAERAAGHTARNEPGDLPRIAQVLASLRGIEQGRLSEALRDNSLAALPRLAALGR